MLLICGCCCAAGRIVAQNRAHFVNSATHVQFKSLDSWIAQHAHELYPILQEGRILYGEYVADVLTKKMFSALLSIYQTVQVAVRTAQPRVHPFARLLSGV
jgi:hypothetical protein